MGERAVRELSGDDDVGRWLAAIADARGRTLGLIDGLQDGDLDRGEPNTIGSVLYHLAAIEADYLYDEIRREPEAIPTDLFPYDVREEDGILTPVRRMTVAEHLDRLETTRRSLEECIRALDEAAFHRPKAASGGYDMSPAYVLYHLTQHEAEHRAEIGRALGRP